MSYMGYKFRAPSKEDVKEWKRIETAVMKNLPWGIPTMRKEKPAKQISQALSKALGIQK